MSAQSAALLEGRRLLMMEQGATFQKQSNWQIAGQSVQMKLLSAKKNVYLLEWDALQLDSTEVISFIEQLPGVLHHHRDAEVFSRSNPVVPNDREYALQWWLPQIQAPLAWNHSTGGNSYLGDTLVVAVLERGAPDFLHEDLRGGIFWRNRAEIPGNGIDDDGNGYIDDHLGLNLNSGNDSHGADIERHASPVVGVLGANTNNSLGVASVNWASKVLVISGVVFVSQIVEAYEYVIQMRERYNNSEGQDGALIVATNASFGRDNAFPEDFPIWCEMYDALGDLGILTAAATSNINVDVDIVGDLPNLCPSNSIISVTSTNREDRKASGAAFGRRNIDLGAPGVAILTTEPGDLYGLFDGTSFAAPMVTGAISLLYSMPSRELALGIKEDPVATSLNMRRAILEGVEPAPDLANRTTTGGRLNLAQAMMRLADIYGQDNRRISVASVVPNPVRTELFYLFNSDAFASFHDVLVHNMMGQELIVQRNLPNIFGTGGYSLDVSSLVPGVYILSIRDGRRISSVKFVKND